MSRLDVKMEPGRITLAGRIDDTAQLSQVVPPVGPLVVDTEGVTFVNSVGMRDWIRFVRALREGGRQLRFERVADPLMTQMNMIGELRGIPVTSFHAQYACNHCGHEATPLIDAQAHLQALQMLAPPKIPCPECQSPMELADFPERYLSIFRS